MSTLKNENFLNNHPVGSIYITTNTNENTAAKMSTLYGGTWTAYGTGRTLVGVDPANGNYNTVEKTGGLSSVNLSASNIPTITSTGTTAAKTVASDSTGNGYSIGYTSKPRTTTSNGGHYHTWSAKSSNDFYMSTSWRTEVNFSYTNTETNHGYQKLSAGVNHWAYIEFGGNTSTTGIHSHSVTDYYANSISGVASHAHNVNVPALSVSTTYTNNAQTSVNVQNPYTTVYMWKRTS